VIYVSTINIIIFIREGKNEKESFSVFIGCRSLVIIGYFNELTKEKLEKVYKNRQSALRS
jgi:glucose uptake protein GlcU